MKRDEYIFIGIVYTLIIGLGLLRPVIQKYVPVLAGKAGPNPQVVHLIPGHKARRAVPRRLTVTAMMGKRGTPVDWKSPFPESRSGPVQLAHGALGSPSGEPVTDLKKNGNTGKLPVS